MSHISQTPYGNWIVFHPDGFEMFRCDDRRAEWYLSRELAKEIEPKKIQLTFVPQGVGHRDEPYYRQSLPNHCFVCGDKEQLTKHHVVPYQFRKLMPVEFKEGSSHDVVWLCRPCHDLYEAQANILRKRLAGQYGLSLQPKLAELKQYKPAYSDLLAVHKHGNKMPPARRTELEQRACQRLGLESVNEDTFLWVSRKVEELEGKQSSLQQQESKALLDAFGDFHEFMRLWRQHFLSTMQPKFMPLHWSVDYKKA